MPDTLLSAAADPGAQHAGPLPDPEQQPQITGRGRRWDLAASARQCDAIQDPAQSLEASSAPRNCLSAAAAVRGVNVAGKAPAPQPHHREVRSCEHSDCQNDARHLAPHDCGESNTYSPIEAVYGRREGVESGSSSRGGRSSGKVRSCELFVVRRPAVSAVRMLTQASDLSPSARSDGGLQETPDEYAGRWKLGACRLDRRPFVAPRQRRD